MSNQPKTLGAVKAAIQHAAALLLVWALVAGAFAL